MVLVDEQGRRGNRTGESSSKLQPLVNGSEEKNILILPDSQVAILAIATVGKEKSDSQT